MLRPIFVSRRGIERSVAPEEAMLLMHEDFSRYVKGDGDVDGSG